MVTLDEAARIALAMPDAVESTTYGNRAWKVRGKTFAWERPFRKADLERFGDTPAPEGPILGARVADLAEKEAILAAGHAGVFTIEHFDGYAAVLIALRAVRKPVLRELVEDAWCDAAPASLAGPYLAARGRPG